jgi:hypothetical protein
MARAQKLSVSIDHGELESARARARASGKSLSAVLTDALREQRRAAAMDRLLRKLGAGKLTAEQLAAAREELYGVAKVR